MSRFTVQNHIFICRKCNCVRFMIQSYARCWVMCWRNADFLENIWILDSQSPMHSVDYIINFYYCIFLNLLRKRKISWFPNPSGYFQFWKVVLYFFSVSKTTSQANSFCLKLLTFLLERVHKRICLFPSSNSLFFSPFSKLICFEWAVNNIKRVCWSCDCWQYWFSAENEMSIDWRHFVSQLTWDIRISDVSAERVGEGGGSWS